MDTTPNFDQHNEPEPLDDETWRVCERSIRRFEDDWRRGNIPDIENYLDVPIARQLELLRELVHVDMEFRFKGGQSTSIEVYLERYPELKNDPEIVVDLIAGEYEMRQSRDGNVDVDEFGRRFPEFRSRVMGRLLHSQRTAIAPSPPQIVKQVPPEVAGYEIIGELGRGGMGVVYRAIDARLGRHVALKFVPPELAGDAVLMQRFIREAKTASGLNHPHICTVHALGEQSGFPFIVLEFIEGQTLKALMASRPAILEIIKLVRQVAEALAAAHAAGVVHRDIKPENLMVRTDGYIKVLDFGLERRLPTLAPNRDPASNDTWPGAVMGTVAFMSPEQARGEPLEGSSDIFALGIVLYQLITGTHPFDRGAAFETMHAIANFQPAPLSRFNADVSPVLDRLVNAMLHKDPRLRPTAAEVAGALSEASRAPRLAKKSNKRPNVHREQELNVLRGALAAAEAGHGSMICVAGEPGIGKTTLIENFLDDIVSRGTFQLACGRCVERQGAASAYLPVLDALAELLRGPTGGTVGRLMRIVAPTWSNQLALADTSATPVAYSQQAMIRELASLLAEVSRLGTTVLFIDDVHWADLSTVDLLAYVGRQCNSQSVLIIVTYRPTELLILPHPFHAVKLDLQGQGLCSELSLGFLDRGQIEDFLDINFPGNEFPSYLAELVHSRTEGNPLFMADLVRYMRERGIISDSAGSWSIERELPEIWRELPETVRSMIQRKLELLEEEDHRMLSVAAMQGQQFDSAIVAQTMELDPADVELSLQRLDRIHGLVRILREDELPDLTPTLRYSFVHVLYQQSFAASLLPTQRRTVTKALAEAWESHLGCDPTAFSAELACLFESGREPIRAARQFHLAAQYAGHVFAHHDAVALAKRGIDQLKLLPVSDERNALELPLQTVLGLQLQVTEGYAARSAELAYERARQLVASSEDNSFPILWGLWLVRKVRSELPHAQELAQELFQLAQRLNDPDLTMQAHQALGITALCLGNPVEAFRHVDQVAALYDVERHRLHAFLFGQDPGVICKAYGAVAMWLLGFPDEAQQQCLKAIEMSRSLSPTSQSVALHFAAMVFQFCRNVDQTLRFAQASTNIASEHGFQFWLAGGTILEGWAIASQGDHQLGLGLLKQGLGEWRATSSVTYMTYHLCLLAETLKSLGDQQAALQVLDDAIELGQRTNECIIESELYRLRGEIRMQLEADPALVETDLRHALEIARQQGATSLELRAATSLVRFQNQIDPTIRETDMLRNVLNSFTEGFNTADLIEARTLLH